MQIVLPPAHSFNSPSMTNIVKKDRQNFYQEFDDVMVNQKCTYSTEVSAYCKMAESGNRLNAISCHVQEFYHKGKSLDLYLLYECKFVHSF